MTDAARAKALAASIAVWLGTMSIAELAIVDAKVMEVLAARDQTWWARHAGDQERWHLVDEVSGGSIATACNGRWSVRDDFDTESRPARADRCGACQSLLEQRRIAALAAEHPIERGLAELRDATPTIPQPRSE